MEITTLLEYSERSQLRAWLEENHPDYRLISFPDGKRLAWIKET